MGPADLFPIDRFQPEIRPVRRSVIKSNKARGENVSTFKLPDMESEKPEITVHRAGEGADTIEFVCTCGCRTTVRLEFDTPDQQNNPVSSAVDREEGNIFSEAP